MRSSKAASFDTTAASARRKIAACEPSILDALPEATRLTRAEERDIPRVAPWLTLRADGPQLISHGCEVESAGRGEGG